MREVSHRPIETYEDVYIVLPKTRLLEAAREAWRLRGPKAMGDNGNVGVLVPVSWLVPSGSGLSLNDERLLDRIGDEVFSAQRSERLLEAA